MTTLNPVRVRYAPSPTGYLHVGGARTALFDYLLARQTGGSFMLRIEDTDQKRFHPEARANLVEAFQYLGLDWDEGLEAGGQYGPYVQTERKEIYQQYIQILLEKGYAYRCFATPEELEAVNEARRQAGLPPGYDRRYRDYDPTLAAQRAADGEPHVIRAKIPLDGTITVHDYLRGVIVVENSTLQDGVLLKSDGLPTYNFAVVVDDHLMKISHVLRGQEYISSFPFHIHLYNFFGWEPPIFVHVPVILNPSGKGKMSKRESRAPDGKLQPVFVHQFKELGYLPEALFNFLALVGWSYDDKTEIMSREELIERFSLERINKSPAAWDYDKLDHFNGLYIRQLPLAELTDRLMPYLDAAGIVADRETMLRITPMIQERLTTLAEIPDWVDFFFSDELPPFDLNEMVPRKMTLAEVPNLLRQARRILVDSEFNHDELDQNLRAGAKAAEVKAGQFFQPIRLAVCGKKVAPPLFDTLEVLGQEKTLQRIDQAQARLAAARVG